MENYPIQPQYEAFFIESMLLNCESALDSIAEIDSIFEAADQRDDREIIDENLTYILDGLQNVISQGAALSRFFWPPKNGEEKIHKKRAKYLRDVFEIKESSPLKNRNLRNAIEHFDEKLDVYFKEPKVGYIINR
jgi:predicted P-loop ATPase